MNVIYIYWRYNSLNYKSVSWIMYYRRITHAHFSKVRSEMLKENLFRCKTKSIKSNGLHSTAKTLRTPPGQNNKNEQQ